MIFFTSDHHFSHTSKTGGIIAYCNRPFSNVGEMNREMIARWNEVVEEDNIVYHLGDLSLAKSKDIRHLVAQLKGQIFILGYPYHHDYRWLPDANSMGITILPPLITVNGIADVPIVLCHFPLAIWDRKHYGSWHLHGHSHGNYRGEGKILDVGVDCWNFYPVSLEQVRKEMEKK